MLPKNPKDFSDFQSVHSCILEICRSKQEKPATVGKGGEGPIYTYGDMGILIGKIAGMLRKFKIRKGDRVGLFSENCPEWGAVYLGILATGAIVVPFDASLKESELGRFLRVAGAKILFTSPKLYKLSSDVIGLGGLETELIQFDEKMFSEIKSNNDIKEYYEKKTKVDDTAVLIYTSGTTGDPKGVILTHRNLLANITSIDQTLNVSEEDKFLSILPLHHTFEAMCGFLFPFYRGLTIVFIRSMKSRDIIEDIKNNQISCVVGVPLLYEKMYNAINRKIEELPLVKRMSFKTMFALSKLDWNLTKSLGKTLFAGLRKKAGLDTIFIFVSGGAPIPPRVAEWFNLIGFNFLPGYGLTECSPVVSVNRPGAVRFESSGPALPYVDFKIYEPDVEGVGEVLVRGDNNTPGYLDNPEATADLIRDGWLYTGDLGKIKNGHLYITGRKKNLIVSGGGKNIYPEEIEAELNLSDFIAESLVLGKEKTGKVGENIWAIIVPDREHIAEKLNIAEERIEPQRIRKIISAEVNAVNARISNYKKIKDFEIRNEEFEKTSTRKIKRHLYK